MTALPDLRTLAKHATTSGPWEAERDTHGGYDYEVFRAGTDFGHAYVFAEEDAAFIAACDPGTIIALLDRLERVEAELRAQWEENHAEHCTNILRDDGTCPWGEKCCWPLPAALGEATAERQE